MTNNKPPGISDQEWAQTPPAVKALLANSLHHIHGIEQNPAIALKDEAESPRADTPFDDFGATMALSSADPEAGATMASPSWPSEDDGATMAVPLKPPSPADDSATMAVPLKLSSAEDDGATMAVPLTPPTSDHEGATVALSSDQSDVDNEGATMAIPSDDITQEAVLDDTLSVSEEVTLRSPLEETNEDIHLSTFNLRADKKKGAANPAPNPASAPTQGKSTQELTFASFDETNQQLAHREIVLQDRYKLRQILGKGGFGAAYLAEDLTLKRGCVVKQMLSPQNISPRELEKKRLDFEREASLLVKLNEPGHSNIPEIFDYFSNENGSYLVMKYIQGQSLQDKLKSQAGPVEWHEAVRYIIDVCSALNYMHTQGEQPVMHRDIKPGNILLGDDGRIWLVDFGLAKTKPVDNTDDIDEVKSAGSAGYTPIEQWLGQAVPASDIYAVGITLHHLVTGLSPLEAFREDGELKVNIVKLQDLHSRLEPIRKISRDLPRELDEIIAAATAAEPEQRPSALQLQQQLQVLVAGAKDAALFTFKNGQSAYTIAELVDLCEQNRVEAQGYLYRGDFERWFTLINRNDLAAAADTAVKHGEQSGKDGLEKFLKLIMPNIFWRRFGRTTWRITRLAALMLLVAAVILLALVITGTLTTSWLLRQTIANRDWDYYVLDLDKDNLFSEAYLTNVAQTLTKAYVSDIQVVPQSPDRLAVQANLSDSFLVDMPITLTLDDNKPHVELVTLNNYALGWVGRTLARGINNGIDEALAKAPIDVAALDVTDGAVVVDIEKNGRVAWSPPTPDPAFIPTSTPIPPPTPTPPGLALLAIFNELDQDFILEIDGQSWSIPAHDTKVIEKAPGSYRYTLTYAANGLTAAEGYRDWTYKAYRWRITTEGSIIE
ncbi:MAG: serine/threonine protein kinase [Anaerolineae bacterium]|nr:serine/threonine protein kinase [Anaerolineae bacterium]